MKSLTALADVFFDNLRLTDAGDPVRAESDKVCFRKSLERFLSSGSKEDAFVVYFCFSEIFKLFGEGYDNTQKLLEMLSDHEYHSGELLSKHRDHYSHSVYAFALGLAVYAGDPVYRKVFNGFYGAESDEAAYYKFLHLWGMSALFHDIGYPFQLAHEQIKNYTEEIWGKKNPLNPFVSFGNLENFTAIPKPAAERIKTKLGLKKEFSNLDELLAYGLNLREGYDEKTVTELLRQRILHPAQFMDHGYFSAVILVKQLLAQDGFRFDREVLDVLTAILLHNSLNKYDLPASHPIALEEHPLCYLLMLCDELQNWDRLAYGKISKRDPIAWDIELEIRENEVKAKYVFESCAITDEHGKKRLNKAFEEIQDGEFVRKIKTYVSSNLTLIADAVEKPKNKKANLYASDNNFINLCDFAKAIHVSYLEFCNEMDVKRINESFEKLPLEFKVSNIEQAKSYAYKLELINCFYSSKDLDYPVVEDFQTTKFGLVGSDNLGFLCREEHVRWVKEKLNMGWKYGTDYENGAERNAKKIHKDIVPFEALSEYDRKKDEVMINNIIPLLKKFGNNIRIYSYRTGRKPDLEIAGMGHRFFIDDREQLKAKIKKVLLKYNEDYRLIVRTCFAYGADQLIAECANELGITTKAVIPAEYEDYIKVVREDCIANGHPFTEEDELRMRHLLAQTVVCKVVADPEFFYLKASEYVLNKCSKFIVLWDGVKLPLYDEKDGGKFINRGGTYHCIELAQQKGLTLNDDIHVIKCHR